MRSALLYCVARVVCVACVVPAILTITVESRAQNATVAINTTGVIRFAADGSTQIPSHIVNGNQQGIGFKDCSDNTYVRFPLTITNLPTSQSLQVWAGTGDCTAAGATSGATATCWPLVQGGGLTPQLALPVNIRVQDIVGQLYATTKTLTYTPADTLSCSSAAASSSSGTTTDDAGNTIPSGETTVNIFFMWFSGGNQTPDSAAPAYPIKVKLVGPGAPTNVTVGSGDGLLLVSWQAPAGEADLQGYYLYSAAAGTITNAEGGTTTTICNDASTGTELFDDAGNPVFDDAGNPVFVDDAGNPVTQDAGCYTVYTPPTQNSCGGSIDTTNTCGDGGPTSGCTNVTQVSGNTNASAKIPNLTNGSSYVVAVSAYDSFGNSGTPSGAVCAVPQPIDDFWKKYRDEGGTGGGFCALQTVGDPAGASGLAIVFIAATIGLVRRRRKR